MTSPRSSDGEKENGNRERTPERDPSLVHSMLLSNTGIVSSWSETPSSILPVGQRPRRHFRNESTIKSDDKWFGAGGVNINSSEFDETVNDATLSYSQTRSNLSMEASSSQFYPLRTDRRSQLLNAPMHSNSPLISSWSDIRPIGQVASTLKQKAVEMNKTRERVIFGRAPSSIQRPVSEVQQRPASLKRPGSPEPKSAPPAKKKSSSEDFDDDWGDGLGVALSQANFRLDGSRN